MNIVYLLTLAYKSFELFVRDFNFLPIIITNFFFEKLVLYDLYLVFILRLHERHVFSIKLYDTKFLNDHENRSEGADKKK